MDASGMGEFFNKVLLANSKIGLRPMVEADFQSLYAVASDPGIWLQHPDQLRYTREGFSRFFESAFSEGSHSLIIFHPLSGEVMGSSRYYRHNPEAGIVYIGYTFLARKYWGGMWNARLKFQMLEYALLHCRQVFFEAAVGNVRSVSALEKLGANRITHSEPGKVLFEVNRNNERKIMENLLLRCE